MVLQFIIKFKNAFVCNSRGPDNSYWNLVNNNKHDNFTINKVSIFTVSELNCVGIHLVGLRLTQ